MAGVPDEPEEAEAPPPLADVDPAWEPPAPLLWSGLGLQAARLAASSIQAQSDEALRAEVCRS